MRATSDAPGPFSGLKLSVTNILNAAIVGVSVLLFLTKIVAEPFVILGPSFGQPWKYLTYPYVTPLHDGFDVVCLLLLAYWLYWIGGTLESELGKVAYTCLWFGACLVCALFVVIGGFIIGSPMAAWAFGSLLPVSFLTVIWGVRHRTASVMMMMVIPMSGIAVALLDIAIVFVDYGQHNLLLAFFACLPLGVAWLYADNRLPALKYSRPKASVAYKPSKEERAREEAYFEEVRKREKDREERERLRRLFEGSINDDDR